MSTPSSEGGRPQPGPAPAHHPTGPLDGTSPPQDDTPMTRAERFELAKLVRLQATVRKSRVAQREAELLADFEQQLATQYDPQDAAWSEIVADARAHVKRIDDELQRRCAAAGIPKHLAPTIGTYWLSRGENATASRRAELRKVATTRIAALGKAAKAAIDADAAERQSELVAGGLTTAAARAFLAEMPTPAGLMPALHLAEIDAGSRGALRTVGGAGS